MSAVKEEFQRIVEALDEAATWEDVLRQCIVKGVEAEGLQGPERERRLRALRERFHLSEPPSPTL